MPDEAPKDPERSFDVVMVGGATEDGEGAKVLRARPGRVDAGEVRPLRDGKPIVGKGEIVRLEKRTDAPTLYDVHVEHKVEPAPSVAHHGPAQVATQSYRESWERIFGGRRDDMAN